MNKSDFKRLLEADPEFANRWIENDHLKQSIFLDDKYFKTFVYTKNVYTKFLYASYLYKNGLLNDDNDKIDIAIKLWEECGDEGLLDGYVMIIQQAEHRWREKLEENELIKKCRRKIKNFVLGDISPYYSKELGSPVLDNKKREQLKKELDEWQAIRDDYYKNKDYTNTYHKLKLYIKKNPSTEALELFEQIKKHKKWIKNYDNI